MACVVSRISTSPTRTSSVDLLQSFHLGIGLVVQCLAFLAVRNAQLASDRSGDLDLRQCRLLGLQNGPPERLGTRRLTRLAQRLFLVQLLGRCGRIEAEELGANLIHCRPNIRDGLQSLQQTARIVGRRGLELDLGLKGRHRLGRHADELAVRHLLDAEGYEIQRRGLELDQQPLAHAGEREHDVRLLLRVAHVLRQHAHVERTVVAGKQTTGCELAHMHGESRPSAG